MYPINSIKTQDRRLHFIDLPAKNEDSPLLIFLHGFPDNAFGWEYQIEVFREKFHILAPFMPGSLNSAEDNHNLELKNLRYDFENLLQTMNPKKKAVYIIGHDLGCFLSNAVSQDPQYNIQGLININGLSLPQYVDRKFSFSQWLKSYYILLAQLPFIRTLVSRLMPNYFLKLIYNLSGLDQNDSIRQNNANVLSGIYIYRQLFKRATSLLFKKSQKNTVPTLFIWGRDDNFLNYPTKTESRKFHQSPVIRILPGGHWVLRSHFQHVNRIIEKTLSNWQQGMNA